MIKFTTVDEVCELVTDGTHYTPKDVGIGVPFLTVKDVSDDKLDFDKCSFIADEDYHTAKLGNSAPQKGDILFSKDGTVGKVHIVNTDKPFAVLSSLAILRPNKKLIESQYLGNVLRLPLVLDDAIKKKTGSAIRRIILADLKKVKFPLPPLEEQKRIAEILDRTQSLISKRKEAIELLDTLTQSIFLEMFGDPVTNPKNIKTLPLAKVCKRITDGTHQPPKWSTSGHPFLFVSNIVSGKISFDTAKFISNETHEELTRRCPIEIDDVLYSTVGSYGVPVIVKTDRKFAFQRHIAHIKPDSNLINSQFLCAMLASPPLKHQADRAARGVAQKTVNLEEIRKFIIFCPSFDVQKEFAQRVEAIEKLKATHHTSLTELQALFASLQHRAFRGEL
jgi:type I restriction enzyme S subunit